MLRKKKKATKKSSGPSSKTVVERADAMARKFCKRGGRCVVGDYPWPSAPKNHSSRLEWAHLKSRSNMCIRHDPRNAMCLCNSCHRYFTQHPDEWTRFCEYIDPGVWDYLNAELLKRNTGVKKPLMEVYLKWIEYYKENDAD